MPGGFPSPAIVVGPPRHRFPDFGLLCHYKDSLRKIGRKGRTTELIRDHSQGILFTSHPENGFNEIVTVYPTKPGRPHNNVLRQTLPDLSFTGCLAFTINTQGSNWVLLDVGSPFSYRQIRNLSTHESAEYRGRGTFQPSTQGPRG